MRGKGVKDTVDNTSDNGRQLTLPLLLEEGRAPRLFASLLGLACVFVAAVVVWASVTTVRELTIAPGQIKPVGSVQLVQHLEGGIVLEILAREGSVVEKGALLIRLQQIAAGSDLGQLRIRAANLTLKMNRLEAAISKTTPAFGALAEKYPELAREHRAVLDRSRNQATNEKTTLNARIEQREADVESYTRQSESVKRQVSIQAQQLKIRRDLLKEGLVSKAAFLEVQRIYEKTHGELLAMRGQLKSSLKALNEARSGLLEYDASWQKKMADERAAAAVELAELKKSVAKHEDRVARLMVRAPMRGVVQEIVPKAIGEVIKSGELVAKIVPIGQELVAEVQVAPDDIGHVKVGDKAEVKVTTFDPAKFGGVTGRVRNLSATTFETEKGEPYFKAVIALERNYLGASNRRYLILPGMVVSAEIVTGAKSLTRYLLKPVFRSLNVAFSER